MSGQSRKLMQAIVSRINRSTILSSATNAIENASGRAHARINDIQNVAAQKYDTIVKQVNGTTMIQDINAEALKRSDPIPKRLVNWWRWYQQLTGVEAVDIAKQQVIAVQDRLFECQDKRRSLTNEASSVTDKLKEIYGELVQTERDDPKYVRLTIMENKGLQEQTRIRSQLRLLENEERDHFTQLATAIKEYHDTQATNAQKFKYLSILASAGLAIVSLCGSMVYNNRRIKDVRIVIAEAQKKNDETFKKYFESLEHIVATNFNSISKQLSSSSKNIVLQEKNVVPRETPVGIDSYFTSRNVAIGALALFFYIYSHSS